MRANPFPVGGSLDFYFSLLNGRALLGVRLVYCVVSNFFTLAMLAIYLPNGFSMASVFAFAIALFSDYVARREFRMHTEIISEQKHDSKNAAQFYSSIKSMNNAELFAVVPFLILAILIAYLSFAFLNSKPDAFAAGSPEELLLTTLDKMLMPGYAKQIRPEFIAQELSFERSRLLIWGLTVVFALRLKAAVAELSVESRLIHKALLEQGDFRAAARPLLGLLCASFLFFFGFQELTRTASGIGMVLGRPDYLFVTISAAAAGIIYYYATTFCFLLQSMTKSTSGA